MSDVTTQKIDARLRFIDQNQPTDVSREFDAMVHLFEHQYSDSVKFWYGVAEIDSVPGDWSKYLMSLHQWNLGVRLSDGRAGGAKVLAASDEDPITQISFVGFSQLDMPRK